MTATDRTLFVPAPRRREWLIAVAMVVGFGSLFVYPAQAAEPVTVIKLTNRLKFEPATVTVKVGDTVQWRNGSVLVHTVTDDPDLVAKDKDYALPEGATPFDSGKIKPKGTFEYTFTTPGTYKYFCIPHEAAKMVAEVIVTK